MAVFPRLLAPLSLAAFGLLLAPDHLLRPSAGDHVSKKSDTGRPGVAARSPISAPSGPAPSVPSGAAEFPARADHAWTLPAGARRDAALDAALADWTLLDPISAAEWIAPRLTGTGPLDRALARVVARTDAAQRPTALAREWAESVCSPALRFDALAHVLREWSEQDEGAALRYAEREAPLAPDAREHLLRVLLPRERET
jgi:hypothetical protein